MLTVPNLFPERHAREAKQLYSLYLSHLMAKNRERRIVEACQQIRNYATRLKQPRSADFTFQFDIDALCKLRRFAEAWKQLRRLERIAYGKNINLSAKEWEPEQLDWFWHYHPHILYFLGRYQLSCHLFETLLAAKMMHSEKGLSYQLLPHVYKPIARPRGRHEVTLYHLYRKLDKSLLEWQQWEQFVNGFDPKLFSLADIRRKDLLQDASLLHSFYEAISRERKQRLTANVSTGEPELVSSPDKVQRFQDNVAAKRALKDPVIAQREQQLKEIFPELQRLPL
jgi:hypothetical protein